MDSCLTLYVSTYMCNTIQEYRPRHPTPHSKRNAALPRGVGATQGEREESDRLGRSVEHPPESAGGEETLKSEV